MEDAAHKILELYGPTHEEPSPSDYETPTSFSVHDLLEDEL